MSPAGTGDDGAREAAAAAEVEGTGEAGNCGGDGGVGGDCLEQTAAEIRLA